MTITRPQRLMRSMVAQEIWKAGAITCRAELFKLSSGNMSPFYVNTRMLMGSPDFSRLLVAAVRGVLDFESIRCHRVAGGETAGIPFAAFIAFDLGLPLLYVRKRLKGHGLQRLVEGPFVKGETILLVEDLITDASSKLAFVNAIRSEGLVVNDVLVLFDRQQGGAETLLAKGIQLHSLSNMRDALEVGTACGYLDNVTRASIEEYVNSPEQWHSERGLQFHSVNHS